MIIDFSANIDDIVFLECQLDCSAEIENGEPVVSVNRVLVDDIDLEKIETNKIFHAMLAAKIRQQAEDSDAVIEQALERADISYSGAANDPEARWKQYA